MEARERQLFASAQNASPARRYSIFASVVVHAIFLSALLYQSRPIFVKVTEVRAGRSGGSVAIVYSPYYGVATEHTTSSSDSSLQAASPPLELPARPRLQRRAPLLPAKGNPSRVAETSSAPAPPAGQTYGASLYGSLSGPLIRPALPVYGPSPKAKLDVLPGRQEGSVIVEITIDEQGRIVGTRVLQSLGPVIDQRVLEALADWRFTPATRNGIAISSLQDVYFHFPS